MTGVATIARVDVRSNLPPNVLIHFDGWGERFDYVAAVDDPDLHPAGFCLVTGHKLEVPKGYDKTFEWGRYLAEVGQAAVWLFWACMPPTIACRFL